MCKEHGKYFTLTAKKTAMQICSSIGFPKFSVYKCGVANTLKLSALCFRLIFSTTNRKYFSSVRTKMAFSVFKLFSFM